MKYYINYSDSKFEKKRKYASIKAVKNGGFDQVLSYSPESLPCAFRERNKEILAKSRGGGYWIWKPYVICEALKSSSEGDWLFYCDSGAYFVKSVDFLIKYVKSYKQDVFAFDLPLIELQWTKKDVFDAIFNVHEEIIYTNQVLASYFLIRNTKYSRDFFNEFLHYSQVEGLIDDGISKENEIFIENRHDQSIFSLLYKKHGFKVFKDPSQYGVHDQAYIQGALDRLLGEMSKNKSVTSLLFNSPSKCGDYPQLIVHNRKESSQLSYIKYLIKNILYRIRK